MNEKAGWRWGAGWVLCAGVLLLVWGACAPPLPPPATVAPPTPTSQLAAAVATLQTGPAATARVLSAATAIAASPVQISDAFVNPGTSADFAVTLSNVSQQPVDLGNWSLFVGDYVATLPSNEYTTVQPAKSKIVHFSGSTTGSGSSAGDDIYIGGSSVRAGGPGVLTTGNKVVLVNAQNQVASVYQLP